ELEAVVSVGPSEVVDKLILSDVTSLRKRLHPADDAGKTCRAQRGVPGEEQGLRERAQRLGFVLRKLGNVVASSGSELVGLSGRENVRLLELKVPRRLVGQR